MCLGYGTATEDICVVKSNEGSRGISQKQGILGVMYLGVERMELRKGSGVVLVMKAKVKCRTEVGSGFGGVEVLYVTARWGQPWTELNVADQGLSWANGTLLCSKLTASFYHRHGWLLTGHLM
jgi:hypothetical protein